VLVEPRFTAGTGSAFNENFRAPRESLTGRARPPRAPRRRHRVCRHPHRHLRLALSAVARRILPATLAAGARARVTRPGGSAPSRSTGRSTPCSTRQLPRLARRHSRRLRLRRQGRALITHMKRLADVERPLAHFFASGVLRLGPKLGPISGSSHLRSTSIPSGWPRSFRLLPRNTDTAAALARRHDRRVTGRAWLRTDRAPPLRHALESVHESFVDHASSSSCGGGAFALVVADTRHLARNGRRHRRTSCMSAARRRRAVRERAYTEAASLEAGLAACGRGLRGRAPANPRLVAPPAPFRPEGRDVFVYFDNDVKVRAPFDAMALAHRLKLGPRPAPPPDSPACASTAHSLARFGRGRDQAALPRRRSQRREPSEARCNPRDCARALDWRPYPTGSGLAVMTVASVSVIGRSDYRYVLLIPYDRIMVSLSSLVAPRGRPTKIRSRLVLLILARSSRSSPFPDSCWWRSSADSGATSGV
jgi:uncharacterized protein YecE (DUF72 family)